MSSPLVSIVTPAYNAERFLRQCIESVRAQTYENWDYTIVNNCSTDRTLEIAEEYARLDRRIKVVTNSTFVPVIANYNNAVRQISPDSRFCKVVAADDWIFPRCIEEMVRLALAHPSVAIVGAYGQDETTVRWTGLPYPSEVVAGETMCRRDLLEQRYVFGTPTSVLYDSEIVRSRVAFYKEDNLHCDSEVCIEFLANRDFGFVHQVLTFQRTRGDSMTSYSERMQTYLPWKLQELKTYGRRYFSDAEVNALIEKKLDDYYRYLSGQLLRRREGAFWKYHAESLERLGFPMSKRRIAMSLGSRIADLVLNPKATVEDYILPRIRSRRQALVDPAKRDAAVPQ